MYSSKEVKRSIRTFQNASQDVLDSAWYLFESRVDKLFSIVNRDSVIKQIVGPYLTMEITHDLLDCLTKTSFVPVKLSPDHDQEIASVLQVLQHLLSQDALHSVDILTDNKGLNEFKMQYLVPVFRELNDRLTDLEDEVEKKKKVRPGSLQIIKIGTIHSNNSSIGVGSDIHQSKNETHLNNKTLLAKWKSFKAKICSGDRIKLTEEN